MPKVANLLKCKWQEELERNGLSPMAHGKSSDGTGVTCPACGTTAPLENGACSDCGLVLA